jgi:CubicO group peptidase (beta-lactamase class C family)
MFRSPLTLLASDDAVKKGHIGLPVGCILIAALLLARGCRRTLVLFTGGQVTKELGRLAAHLSELIPKKLSEHAVPGLAIGIVHRGDSWLTTYGRTRRDGDSPVAPETIFGLQSIAKSFTTYAVLAAARDESLDLDVPISAYLPEFTVHSRFDARPQDQITLRLLLAHAAGLTHDAPVGNNFIVGTESFERHIESISDTWLRWPVGARCGYSNLSLDLAGYILSSVRGDYFANCVRDLIFRPLRMDRSTFDPDEADAFGDRAVGHDSYQVPTRTPMIPAAGMYSCMRDLVRFLDAELSESPTFRNLASAARESPYPIPGHSGRYQLGLSVIGADDWTVYGHSGQGSGFACELYWEPAAHSGIAILTNATNHPMRGTFAMRILSYLAGRDSERPHRPEPPASRLAAATDYGVFCGEYVGGLSHVTLVERDGVIGCLDGAGKFLPAKVLTAGDLLIQFARAPGTAPVPVAVKPVSDGDGRPSHLLICQDGFGLSFNAATSPPSRRDAARAIADAARYCGEYSNPPAGPVSGSLRLDLADERLWLTLPSEHGLPRLRLDPHETIDRLYFSSTGETLDLRPDPPTFGSVPLLRCG